MPFEVIESLSLPGDPQKPNEDAFAAEPFAALVLDGATMVSENLMPGRSDAAWIASFGARRLMAHLKEGISPRAALRHALADAERSFAGLRRRAPQQPWEYPLASMTLAVPEDDGFGLLWYGDCAALMLTPDGATSVVGPALERKAGETSAAQRFLDETGLGPVEALKGDTYLPLFRAGREKANTAAGEWLFSPVAAASEHVFRARYRAPAGTLVLLCSDGFLALASAYNAMTADELVAAARDGGLKALGERLRGIEDGDPEGRRYPRFKKSDDATAVLVRVI
ncbi:protein phosphatase 2C domain-containing protein [Rhizomicrobium electricum]|uniref:Protein phosphatase 2C domain-containing protein n=1 Tax=Rhizomicrobium electricum TaxID=480070 RepID=A0ABP3PZU6_9PROT|nr:protein phosphatase 2C domain-containing protein [Rhizomicrobium electricum]NIJ49588.1 hypothetical protein [Rhizomicrobium electricum]